MNADQTTKTVNQIVGRFQDEMWTVINESNCITNYDIPAQKGWGETELT